MPSQTKPNVNTVWASGGLATPVTPEKQALGFVAEIPEYDDFNGLIQQISAFLKHVNQEGIPVWDASTPYFETALTKSPVDGEVYQVVNPSVGVPPVTVVGGAVSSYWRRYVPQLSQAGHGQCRLIYTSTTQLKLIPYNGRNVIVNGLPVQIPAAGLTLSNGGLAATTQYYIYLTPNATLEASTTGHSTHTDGVEIKTGDPTRTLVGMAATVAGGLFSDTPGIRFVLSWFNRRNIAVSTYGSGYTITNGSEVSSLVRNQFLSWADEIVEAVIDMQAVPNTTAARCDLIMLANNATTAVGQPEGFGRTTGTTAASATYALGLSKTGKGVLPEGRNYITAYSFMTDGTASVSNINILTTIRG